MDRIRECNNAICHFRFPDFASDQRNAYCPLCGEITTVVETINTLGKSTDLNSSFNQSIEILPILDNIRSVYNVGSILRTCDGFGIKHILLCGITPDPNNPKLQKTSLGAEKTLKWQKQLNAVDAVISLKDQGYQIVSLETGSKSRSMDDSLYKDIQLKIALIVGNEKIGVDPGLIKLSDTIVNIPMTGFNQSFNVAVAFGIFLYYLTSHLTN